LNEVDNVFGMWRGNQVSESNRGYLFIRMRQDMVGMGIGG